MYDTVYLHVQYILTQKRNGTYIYMHVYLLKTIFISKYLFHFKSPAAFWQQDIIKRWQHYQNGFNELTSLIT